MKFVILSAILPVLVLANPLAIHITGGTCHERDTYCGKALVEERGTSYVSNLEFVQYHSYCL